MKANQRCECGEMFGANCALRGHKPESINGEGEAVPTAACGLAAPSAVSTASPISSDVVCEAEVHVEVEHMDFDYVNATLFTDGRIEFDRPVFDPAWAKGAAEDAFLAKDQDILICDHCGRLFDSSEDGRCDDAGAWCFECKDYLDAVAADQFIPGVKIPAKRAKGCMRRGARKAGA